ncbi:Imm49 family immunity protein [Kitasatospora phosalacinea]|uniref:Imm49 family immunity protein n=1 Tax=Kitasatospora phosalacinea TaxID=2065 RepID=UPI00052581FC|nr:Imm49 family immunity protein [Kitasatospora phosalacinea]
MICREEERLTELAAVPTEFLRASGAMIDEYAHDWSADGNRDSEPQGYVALAPLAVAVLAHDASLPIEVESESESEYLPLHLLRGRRAGVR